MLFVSPKHRRKSPTSVTIAISTYQSNTFFESVHFYFAFYKITPSFKIIKMLKLFFLLFTNNKYFFENQKEC